MPYKVDLHVQQDFVRVEVTGKWRLGDAATDAGLAGKQIVDVCRVAAAVNRSIET